MNDLWIYVFLAFNTNKEIKDDIMEIHISCNHKICCSDFCYKPLTYNKIYLQEDLKISNSIPIGLHNVSSNNAAPYFSLLRRKKSSRYKINNQNSNTKYPLKIAYARTFRINQWWKCIDKSDKTRQMTLNNNVERLKVW